MAVAKPAKGSPRHIEPVMRIGQREVHLTNLDKVFWPEIGVTKRHLLQYYLDISRVLLPHLTHRAMVMKRYPNGAAGKFFFMKRAPEPRPAWLKICPIQHPAAGMVDFPVVDDLASLLWIVNLGCIDLNPWYADVTMSTVPIICISIWTRSPMPASTKCWRRRR
jgi:bifunctional non-homologous end joining protein LigD